MMKMKKEEYSWKQYISDYWALLKGRRTKFLFFTLLMVFASSFSFVIAFLLGKIIDFFIGYGSGESLTLFYYYVFGIAFFGAFAIWLRFFAKVRLKLIGGTIRKESRITAMSKMMELELKWHEKEETGSKIQKINQGGEGIYSSLTSFMNDGIAILTGIIGSLLLFIFLDFRYLLFALVYIGIYLIGEYYFNKRLNYWEDESNKVHEKVSGKMHESTSNLLTIKSLGLKESFRKSTSTMEDKYYEIWKKKVDIHQLKFKTIKIFGALGYAGFILFIGFDVVTGLITAGSLLVFASYFDKLRSALGKITNKTNDFIKNKSSVGRFMTIFGEEIIDKETDLAEIPVNWKTIEFKDVEFKYKNKIVLKDFNLKIKRNEKIGVVGKSGTGKSTITKLLLGLYEPQKGEILIDGINLRKYKHKSLTDNISVVLQDSEMFNSSLLNNITISTSRNNFKSFEKSVEISQLKDVIKKLPQGINTLIGEKGYQLSGGERQRIGIARSIYKDTPFIILDEATSSLDSKTEDKIQLAIEKELANKTFLIIAHRLSTIKHVDTVILIDKGKMIERGTYNELLKKRGEFYKLWEKLRKR